MFRRFLVGVALAAAALAQGPHFEQSEVRVPNSTETAPLLPGTLMSIYGEYLGPAEACQADWESAPLETLTPELLRMPYSVNTNAFPKELCGVRVLVDGEPAGLLYVQRDQINFKVPFGAKLAGTVDLQVIHGDLASAAVAMPAGLVSITLSVTQPAYTNMPIWVDLATRPRWFAPLTYGYDGGPNDFGCLELQVRKDGRLLEPRTIPPLVGGVRNRPWGGVSDICGTIGPRYTRPGPLPLHLAYRFGEPGEYQVRLVKTNTFHGWMAERKRLAEDDPSITASSAWTTFRVEASTEERRRAWLDSIAEQPPQQVGELIGSYIPSLLGIPDEDSLQLLVAQMYHGDPYVRRFAMAGLGYWTSGDELTQALLKVLAQRGPSDVVVDWLMEDENGKTAALRILETSLPYLSSDDPVALRGAVRAIDRPSMFELLETKPELKERVASAMIEAAGKAPDSANDRTLAEYAYALGQLGDARALPVLRNWAREELALPATLAGIAKFARNEDLAMLEKFLSAPENENDYVESLGGVPQALFESYGFAAVPVVERILGATTNGSMSFSCLAILLDADRPAGWAFAARAIETNNKFKEAATNRIRRLHPEVGADETAILALARSRAAQ